MAQAQPIEHFGKYQILERVARGGMAEIYKARMEGIGGFNRLFAIKRILPSLSQNREYIDLLVDEAKVAGLLSHANIVQILDLGEVKGQYYVAMEYVNGRDLGRVLSRCQERGITLPVPHSVFVLIEVLKGLEYAHNRQIMRGKTPMPLDIVHRDVSPSNVLVSFQGEVKLTDFGIAKAKVKALQTVSGVIKGKFDYMSPEQARGESLDPRTDLFAAGVLLYEMLCGVHPFRTGGDLKTIAAIKAGRYTAPTVANPDVPYSLELVLDRALALDPDERFQSATEFKEALTRFFHDAGFIFSHSTLAAFLKGLFPEASGRRRAKVLELKDQHTMPMPIPDKKAQAAEGDEAATYISRKSPPSDTGVVPEQARISFGPQPDEDIGDESSFISLDSIEGLTNDLEEATETAAQLELGPPIEQDPDPSRNFGPLSDPLDDSTLLRPGSDALRAAVQRANPSASEWADDSPTMIRGPVELDGPQHTEDLEELELDEPTRNELPKPPVARRSAPLPPPPQQPPPRPAGQAPLPPPPAVQPQPRQQARQQPVQQPRQQPVQQPRPRPTSAAQPTGMSRRTQLLMALVAITCLIVGFSGGVLTGLLGSGKRSPLPVAGPIKQEPRLLVTLPQGATLQRDDQVVPLAESGPTPLTLRAGEPVRLRVTLEGHSPLEQEVTLHHNEERVLDIQLARLEPERD
ncbi:MAG: serine/threonine-protein kinase [Myxococcota bacterium]|nr:serine/threonine-protein kinase [Myxococcota bacterium]